MNLHSIIYDHQDDYEDRPVRQAASVNRFAPLELGDEKFIFCRSPYERPDRMPYEKRGRASENSDIWALTKARITGEQGAICPEWYWVHHYVAASRALPVDDRCVVIDSDRLASVTAALDIWAPKLTEHYRVMIAPDWALKVKNERRIRARVAPKNKPKFIPSHELCRFVLLADETSPREGRRAELTAEEARLRGEHISNAVFGLLQSVADSLRRRKEQQYVVASEGQFEDSFAQALLFRIRVAVYGQRDFLDALFREMSSSDVSANEWTLNSRVLDSLVLDVIAVSATPERNQRKRATPVRLKMTEFPND